MSKLVFGDPTAIKMAQGATLQREWTEETLGAAKEAATRAVTDIQWEGFEVDMWDHSCAPGNNHSITIEITPCEEWVFPEETAS